MDDEYFIFNRNIRKILEKYRITPNKELGQCFISNWNLIRKEIEYAQIGKKDIVLEIGAGIGNLTEILAREAKRIIAIEKDFQFKNILSELQLRYDNIEIIYGDALEIDFPKFNKIVSNLPYKIALPLIFKILDQNFDIAVLTCPERLAQRICAKPGQKGYSRLSVQIYRLSNPYFLKLISREEFTPSPDVISAMIKLEKTPPKFKIPSENFFKEFLKFLFSQRDNSIDQVLKTLNSLGVSKNKTNKIKIELDKRTYHKKVYKLRAHEFGSLSWYFWKFLGKRVVKVFHRYYKLKKLYNRGGSR